MIDTDLSLPLNPQAVLKNAQLLTEESDYLKWHYVISCIFDKRDIFHHPLHNVRVFLPQKGLYFNLDLLNKGIFEVLLFD